MVGEALRDAVLKAVHALESEGIPYALFGGLAVNSWGRVRHTMDGDLIVFGAAEDLGRALDRLRFEGFSHHGGTDRFSAGDIEVRRAWYPLKALGVSVKVDLVRSGSGYYLEVRKRRTRRRILGEDLWTVSLEDLILLKLAAGRPVDRVDAIELARVHRASLDRPYLEGWASRLGAKDALTDIITESERPEPPF